ncbi:DHA2 family efflux MFS transporter permease subunit [Myxococcus sp. RHSTA-1-4]|uniref:DHA2 family efflux MFS transporter permease subunit n=1 Tax=Myxococcus sp. RHSTA-1-4 TaxID=2874601 RepID=UPI001CBB0CE9|nr:DHA2 family efflux MFS transporter permease subunit [Myxococcus sp. RHSTA-1-4]MBZ4419738.1 DHA2 family efflux MFS transporter permease subunit [Myxococcus sp. RHSTA-1-4]
MATTVSAPAASVAYASPRGRGVLLASILGSGMAFLDGTAVNVALPAIGRELETGLSGLQWAVDAYLLTLGSLVLTGGALGDAWGQRRVFLLGLVAFAFTSVLCGLAPSAWTLALFRAAQGMGAALLVPASLALLRTSFPEADRQRAVSTWAGLSGVTTAVGPLLGGWLVDAVSWRIVFFLNVPVGALAVWVALRHVPASAPKGDTRGLDLAGAVTAALGLGGVIYALIEGPAHGWNAPAILAVTGGAALLAAFVFLEARERHPMLPLTLFRSPIFSGANLTTLVVYFALGGATFLVVLALQQQLGYSALGAGAALLPITLLLLLLSPAVGRLAGRIGARPLMTAGPLLAGVGLALLTRLQRDGDYVGTVLPGVTVLGLGLALTVGPLTAVVLGAVEDPYAGIASGVNNAVARIAGLLAVALLPLLGGLAGDSGADFLAGTRRALWVSAGLCAVGALCSLLTIPREAGRARQAPPPKGSRRGTVRMLSRPREQGA